MIVRLKPEPGSVSHRVVMGPRFLVRDDYLTTVAGDDVIADGESSFRRCSNF